MKSITNRALLAALAFGLASGPVSAAIDLNKSSTDTADDAGYKYAQETLASTTAMAGTDGQTYYKLLAADNALQANFKTGMAIQSADTALIRVTLNGLAFSGTSTQAANIAGNGSWTRVTGGQNGDTTALFRSGAQDVGASDVLNLQWPGATGQDEAWITSSHKAGITIEVINVTLEGVLGTGNARSEISRDDLIVGSKLIKSNVVGDDDTATVASGFMGFTNDGEDKTAVLGTVQVALTTGLESATATDGTDAVRTDAYTGGKLKLKGNFSFVDTVRAAATASAACGTSGGVLFSIAKDKMSAEPSADTGNNIGAGAIGDRFNDEQHICLTVKEDTVIPPSSYTIDIDYTTPLGKVSPLADVTDAPFGNIKRDGTTINIPFVSTHDKYNQRFMIVNNGAATTYAFTFMPEDGITATAGSMASGDLPMGTTHLKVGDIVMLEGGQRTAATFTAVARNRSIEMSSVLVTRETGATDVTILAAE